MALTKVKAGNIILTTPGVSSNDVPPATTQYVTTAIGNLIDTAPSTLNTLNELAAALGDDPAFATTVNNNIATKLPLAGGAMTGAITTNSTFDGRDVATDGTKLDTIATNANNYSHPANHAISVVTGLQAALDSKASTTSVNNLSTVYDPIGASVAMAIALGG